MALVTAPVAARRAAIAESGRSGKGDDPGGRPPDAQSVRDDSHDHSAANSPTEHFRCCTALATTARTCDRSDSPRTVSATARAAGANLSGPSQVRRSGILAVRWMTT
jgi:hypothetical protein